MSAAVKYCTVPVRLPGKANALLFVYRYKQGFRKTDGLSDQNCLYMIEMILSTPTSIFRRSRRSLSRWSISTDSRLVPSFLVLSVIPHLDFSRGERLKSLDTQKANLTGR